MVEKLFSGKIGVVDDRVCVQVKGLLLSLYIRFTYCNIKKNIKGFVFPSDQV